MPTIVQHKDFPVVNLRWYCPNSLDGLADPFPVLVSLSAASKAVTEGHSLLDLTIRSEVDSPQESFVTVMSRLLGKLDQDALVKTFAATNDTKASGDALRVASLLIAQIHTLASAVDNPGLYERLA